MAPDASADAVQVVDGQGNFNISGLDNFVKSIKLSETGLAYAVVAIMGPQSSGKSTLLNHLFGTRFVEMDAFRGRSQTTQGIWMSKAVDIEPCTIVCDLEGTDGRERGEDDTTFEKQSSLFGLAISDVVLVNMWCHDIGREQAANKPLLKTVFQVMMRLFTPRKTTLLFVIRDKTRTPLETLEPILREDVQKIWDSVRKPEQHLQTPLSEFFNIEVTALSNYEEKEEQFNREVAVLRERFQNSISIGRIAGDRRGAVPGTGFPISIQEIWRVIKENKDLDLPAHKVMVATVRCEEIVKEKIDELQRSEVWQAVSSGAHKGAVPGFGGQVAAILRQCIVGYDVEAAYFDEGVRVGKRQFLLAKASELLHPAYVANVGHHRVASFERFRAELDAETGGKEGSAATFAASAREVSKKVFEQFDAGLADSSIADMDWDSSKTREKLKRDTESHIAAVKAEKLKALVADAEKHFVSVLLDPVGSLLDSANAKTWPRIRKLLESETSTARAQLAASLSGFELPEEEVKAMELALEASGRSAVEKRVREEASLALLRMKDRFNTIFSRDADSLPRRWTGSEDLRAITRDARSAALKVLSVLAAIRLQENSHDSIESSLLSLLGEQEGKKKAKEEGEEGEGGEEGSAGEEKERSQKRPKLGRQTKSQEDLDLNGGSSLMGSSWEKVPPGDTVLTPSQCRALWRQFKSETEYTISQAMQAQEASRRGNSWLPPPWAILAMIVLGFNEAMTLVRNPVLLITLVVIYFVVRALWVQLDAAAEFENGLISGVLAVSAKVLPTSIRILKKLIEEGQGQIEQHTGYRSPRRQEGIQLQSFNNRSHDHRVPQGVSEEQVRKRAKISQPLDFTHH